MLVTRNLKPKAGEDKFQCLYDEAEDEHISVFCSGDELVTYGWRKCRVFYFRVFF
jgi:hypothetical protein